MKGIHLKVENQIQSNQEDAYLSYFPIKISKVRVLKNNNKYYNFNFAYKCTLICQPFDLQLGHFGGDGSLKNLLKESGEPESDMINQ